MSTMRLLFIHIYVQLFTSTINIGTSLYTGEFWPNIVSASPLSFFKYRTHHHFCSVYPNPEPCPIRYPSPHPVLSRYGTNADPGIELHYLPYDVSMGSSTRTSGGENKAELWEIGYCGLQDCWVLGSGVVGVKKKVEGWEVRC